MKRIQEHSGDILNVNVEFSQQILVEKWLLN